ncbi:MAG TPA: hypothetical protein VHP33_34640 [Polyangiaceae bacterium]|nr:hypothetical protein [Polyangiaceae bacterium]
MTEGNFTARLYFKIESTWWASRPTVEEIPKHYNVLAHRLWIDVAANDVPPDVAEYICARSYSDDAEKPAELEAQLKEMGYAVLAIALRTYNRLIDYARSKKGQYRLTQYPLERRNQGGLLNRFEAKVRKPNSEWRHFRPSLGEMRGVIEHENLFIRQDEWSEVKAWAAQRIRPPLVGSLLAGAEQLAGDGHTRAALTEAVTALEVALYDFAREPILERVAKGYSPERFGLDSLKAHVGHLGLTGSIGYLLPLLFSENELPTPLLERVRKAVAARQNVVHAGQRAVADNALRDFLGGIRRLCTLLQSATRPEPRAL